MLHFAPPKEIKKTDKSGRHQHTWCFIGKATIHIDWIESQDVQVANFGLFYWSPVIG